MNQGNLGFLPIEMQDHILSYITDPNDMFKVANLSSHFHLLMQRRINDYKYDSMKPVINQLTYLVSRNYINDELISYPENKIVKFSKLLDQYKSEKKDVKKFKFKLMKDLEKNHFRFNYRDNYLIPNELSLFLSKYRLISENLSTYYSPKITISPTGPLRLENGYTRQSIPVRIINKILEKKDDVIYHQSNKTRYLVRIEDHGHFYNFFKKKIKKTLQNRKIYHKRRGYRNFTEWSPHSQRSYQLLVKELKILDKLKMK